MYQKHVSCGTFEQKKSGVNDLKLHSFHEFIRHKKVHHTFWRLCSWEVPQPKNAGKIKTLRFECSLGGHCGGCENIPWNAAPGDDSC